MGIRGLYTYIQEYADAALEWHKLQNCKLVIDGNNLAHEIYSNSRGINTAFGGDYDKYAIEIERFFSKLFECNIEPIVVMDGGYPMQRNKFSTVYSRLSTQLETAMGVHPDNQDVMKIFPIMGRWVFVGVIQKLGVTLLQADFEADDEIVVVAKKLNAYVLSNDSDFYLYDVQFILLHSVNMKHLQKERTKDGKFKKFIPCYRFEEKTFTKITGVRKELIPLLASILGNDYMNPKYMGGFYNYIAHLRPNSNNIPHRKKVIISVIKWLAKQDGNADAVLKRIIKTRAMCVSKKTEKTMRAVLHMYSPTKGLLKNWVLHHSKSCPINSDKAVDNETTVSNADFKAGWLGSSNVTREICCTCESRVDNSILSLGQMPDWFIRAYRMHLIPHTAVDILTKDYVFTVPMIEVLKSNSLYLRLEILIKKIRGLLWATCAHGLILKIRETEKAQRKGDKLVSNKLDGSKTMYSDNKELKNIINKEVEKDIQDNKRNNKFELSTVFPKEEFKTEEPGFFMRNLTGVSKRSPSYSELEDNIKDISVQMEILAVRDSDCHTQGDKMLYRFRKMDRDDNPDDVDQLAEEAEESKNYNKVSMNNELQDNINDEISVQIENLAEEIPVIVKEDETDNTDQHEKKSGTSEDDDKEVSDNNDVNEQENDEVSTDHSTEVSENDDDEVLAIDDADRSDNDYDKISDNDRESENNEFEENENSDDVLDNHNEITDHNQVSGNDDLKKLDNEDLSFQHTFEVSDLNLEDVIASLPMHYFNNSSNKSHQKNKSEVIKEMNNDVCDSSADDNDDISSSSNIDKSCVLMKENGDKFYESCDDLDDDNDFEYDTGNNDIAIEDIDSSDDSYKENEKKNVQNIAKIYCIPPIRLFVRERETLIAKTLPQEKITTYKKYPSLFKMNKLTEIERKKLFIKIIGIDMDLGDEELSSKMEFILLCICFWKITYGKHVEVEAILAVVMCAVMFNIVDDKTGRLRSKGSDEEVLHYLDKIQTKKQSGSFPEASNLTIDGLIQSLTIEECKLASLSLDTFHKMDPTINRRSYDKHVVHAFSEYQACVYFLQYLNSLLYFPYPVVSMDAIWSGTFCYNIHKCFAPNKDINLVLATIFNGNDRVSHLFLKLYAILQTSLSLPSFNVQLPKLNLHNKIRKKVFNKKRKTSKKKQAAKDKENIEKEMQTEKLENPTEEDIVMLGENKFSALLIM